MGDLIWQVHFNRDVRFLIEAHFLDFPFWVAKGDGGLGLFWLSGDGLDWNVKGL